MQKKSYYFVSVTLFLLVIACDPMNSGSNNGGGGGNVDTTSLLSCPTSMSSGSDIGTAHSQFTEYLLVCQDEFNTLDTSVWLFDTEGNSSGWGNSEQQFYTNTGGAGTNAYVSSGELVIEAKSVTASAATGGKSYTSARLHTHGTLKVRYGLIEARVKLPANTSGVTDAGTWPAFWLLGENFNGWGHDSFGGNTTWPQAGEIDIVESNTVAHGYNTVLGTLHWANSSNSHSYEGSSVSITNATQWHVYSAVWEADKITFYLDHTTRIYEKTFTAEMTEFQAEFFLLLNLAVGGNLVGAPDAAKYPQLMYVDYVRIYQK